MNKYYELSEITRTKIKDFCYQCMNWLEFYMIDSQDFNSFTLKISKYAIIIQPFLLNKRLMSK